MRLPNLRDTLNEHFSKEQLHELCFDLNIEYENLPGDTRLAKAQALVEHCLRHDCLPDLVQRCRELRPAANCPDAATVSAVTAEWQQVQQAISVQEDLRGILPAEQTAPVLAVLAALRRKETEIVTQLAGSVTVSGDVVAGDKMGGDKVAGDKITGHIINIYREGDGRLSPVTSPRRNHRVAKRNRRSGSDSQTAKRSAAGRYAADGHHRRHCPL